MTRRKPPISSFQFPLYGISYPVMCYTSIERKGSLICQINFESPSIPILCADPCWTSESSFIQLWKLILHSRCKKASRRFSAIISLHTIYVLQNGKHTRISYLCQLNGGCHCCWRLAFATLVRRGSFWTHLIMKVPRDFLSLEATWKSLQIDMVLPRQPQIDNYFCKPLVFQREESRTRNSGSLGREI